MINKIFTNKLSLIGLLMIALLFILAAMAQFIAPHGPHNQFQFAQVQFARHGCLQRLLVFVVG